MIRRLPPYGKSFIPVPPSGVRVAIGPTAWGFAQNHYYPCMVMPDEDAAAYFEWPSDGHAALVYERGDYNDDRLEELARELLVAGASSVVALREALIDDYDCRVFFDKEVADVAA